MAKSSLTLWIDVDTNRVLDGWNSNNEAPVPSFVAGDTCEIEIHLVRKNASSQFEELPTTGKSFKLAIGVIDRLPSGGSWTLAYGNSQIDFDFDEKPEDVQTALNLIPEIIADGGVTVTLVNGDTTYRVMFNEKVALSSTFSTDASNLIPSSIIQKSEVKVGSSTTKAVWHFKPKQVPVVYQPNWTQSTNSSIATLTNLGGGVGRIEIKPDAPRGGTFTLGAYLYEVKKYAPNQGQTTYNYVTTFPISVNATESDFDNCLPAPVGSIGTGTGTQFDLNGVTVKKVGAYAWDFTTKSVTNQHDSTWYNSQYYIDAVTNGSIIPFEYVSSTISLNNYEVASLLAGIGSVEAVLEVEVTENGAVTTVLQTQCKIISDIIGQHTYSPTPFDDPLTQSDLNAALVGYIQDASNTGSTYGRKNGQWETVLPLAGGAMDSNAFITLSSVSANADSELAGWGLGIEKTDDHTKYATVEYNAVTVQDGANYVQVTADGVRFNDGTTQTTSAVTPDLTNYFTKNGGQLNEDASIGLFNGSGRVGYFSSESISLSQYPQGTGQSYPDYQSWLSPTKLELVSNLTPSSLMTVDANGLIFPDSTVQTTAATTPDLSGYALLSGATFESIIVDYDGSPNYPFRVVASSTPNKGVMMDSSKVLVGADPEYDLFGRRSYVSDVSIYIEHGESGQVAGIYTNATNPAIPPMLRMVETDGVTGTNVTEVKQGKIFYDGVELYATKSELSTYAPLDGATFTDKVVISPSSLARAGFNIGGGVAPAYPVAGDLWFLSASNYLYYRSHASATSLSIPAHQLSNTFSANQIIDLTSNTSAALRITQKGTYPALVVEDATNPDTNAFVVNADGVVGIQKDPATWTPTAGVALDVTGNSNFTGKATFTSVGGAAGINIGIGGTNTTAVTAGDMWITTGGSSLNYRDGNGTWRVLPNTGSINTFTQPQVISPTTTSTTPALRITNIATAATAHSLLVEDETNPDITAFIINNAGNIGIGVPTGWTPTEKFEINGNIKFTADSSVQTTAYIPSAVAITGGSINGITIDGGTY